MVVRITASAADASSAWDLKCDLREQLLEWVHQQHPEALPRMRTTTGDSLIEREPALSARHGR